MSEQQEQSRTCSSYAKSRAKKDVMQMNDVKEIILFLTDLSENNNKDWFHANRQRYTEAKKMAEALCAELTEGIRGFDPYVGTLSPEHSGDLRYGDSTRCRIHHRVRSGSSGSRDSSHRLPHTVNNPKLKGRFP
jgi:uncharacterized protein (DUF2461 family)